MTIGTAPWTGLISTEDTALACTDTGGDGTAIIYLNGQFATQGYWRKTIAELGPQWRRITFDERGRGRKSKTSSDYSLEAAVRDVDAVLAARGVERAVVSAGRTARSSPPTGPTGTPSGPSARSWSTGATRTTGWTRRWSSGSASCSSGCARSWRRCARPA